MRVVACVCLVGFLLIGCSEEAQIVVESRFIKLYGGEGFNSGIAVEQTQEDGYVYVGNSYSNTTDPNDQKICLIKTDKFGNREWIKYYGETGKQAALSVKRTSNNEFLVFGNSYENLNTTQNSSPFSNFFLLKTDTNGELLWEKNYGTQFVDEQARCFNLTSDGGMILAGNISEENGSSDTYLIRTNADGELQWESRFGLLHFDDPVGNSILELPDGGFVFCGTEIGRNPLDSTDSNVRIIKVNERGSIEWSQTYGGPTPEIGIGLQIANFGFIAIATQETTNNDNDIFVIGTNFYGEELWSKTLGGLKNDVPVSVKQTNGNTLIICGTTESFGKGQKDIYLINTSMRGEEIWSRTFGSIYNDSGSQVMQLSNGDLVIAGTIGTNSNTMMGLLKADSNGRISK